MTAGFGGSGYTNPQTRALNSIANGGEEDTSSQEAMVALLQKHSAQLRYLASNQKQMQKGINDATANPVQQLQQFVADIIVLLGGGELAKGALDFGDLQYVLPALGALFGFGDGPFPISLFEAASKFFLGYVVPQEQFVDVINNIITAWAGVFGIDPEFIADVRDLVAAVGNLFDGIGNLFPSLNELFSALGITAADLGPLGQLLAPIIQLFAGIDLTKFGDFIEFITDAISPFIEQLTALINFINGMLAVLGYDGGDVVNSPIELLLRPFQNLIKFLADLNLFDPDFDLGAAAEAFVNLIIAPLNIFSIPSDVQTSINAALGNMKAALDGTYSGSGPIFLAIQALAAEWLTGRSPVNAANVFGRLGLGSFGGGLPIMALTTAVPNELEPFTAASVPSSDGWSFNAGQDAAQVVADGSPKALYLQSGVIKVESGQPLDASVKVKYSGVTSGAGQTIRFVLETFTSDDGSGTVTPVVVGAVSNPSGTITTAVTLGNSSWSIPAGVKSVRPVLVVDELVTAGTVYWLNTPTLKKKLAGPLSGGLPKAIQDRIDDMQATWNAFKGGAGGTVGDIEGALDGAGQTIRDAIANALGHAGTGHTSANILTYLQNIPQTVVQNLENDFANADDAIADVFDDVRDGWNKFWDGIFKTTGSTGKTAADVQTAAAEVINTATAAHVSIDSANAAVATWQSQFTQQQMSQPLWLTGTDGTCEVTVPLAWCNYLANSGSNASPLSCASGSHSHAAGTIAINVANAQELGAVLDTAGQFVGGVMRCRGGDLKDTITTYGYLTGGRLVIYNLDPTNGSTTLLYQSADLPSTGTFSYTPIIHEMPAGSEFITTVGQILVVGMWLPSSGLASLAGCPVSRGYTTSSSSFPKSIGVKDTGWSTNAPSSMSNGDFAYMEVTGDVVSVADLKANVVPFFGLGSASPPAPLTRRRFTTQFGTTGVADWVNVTGTFGTINGELSSTALAAGVYKDPLATDSPAAEIHLSPTRTVGKTRIAIKSNADMSKWIGVEFDRTSSTAMTAKILTGTGPDSGLSTRFTSGNVGNTSGPLEADPVTGSERVGGARFRIAYTQASNTYELFMMTDPIFREWNSLGTWVDSGGFTAHGPNCRYGAAVTGINGTPNRGQAVAAISFFDS